MITGLQAAEDFAVLFADGDFAGADAVDVDAQRQIEVFRQPERFF